jgi:branched-chain amino acid transport system permease protein
MSVLGGLNQFFGPFVGAVAIIIIEDIVGAWTEYWSLIIGSLIMGMVILFPKGLVGELHHLKLRMMQPKTRRSE